MKNAEVFELEWAYLLRMVGTDAFLEESATRFGALLRRREVRDARTLLRLAMLYGFAGYSLRRTAAFASMAGIAQISDVAVLKRLRGSAEWIGFLLASKLAERSEATLPRQQLRIRIVDATSVNRPGKHGIDFRIHLGMNLERLCIDQVEITDVRGGETLSRFRFAEGDLVLADRGYAHPAALVQVARGGAKFLVRINWSNVPLSKPDGSRFDLLAALRSLPEATPSEFQVLLRSAEHSIPCRLVAIRKTEAAAKTAREKSIAEIRKQHRNVDPRTLEANGYTFVLTNLDLEIASTPSILELYRFRWQVEMTFKRLKSLLDLDKLPARDPELAKTTLLIRILGALLVEDMTEKYLALSPWGYPLEFEKSLALEVAPSRS